MQQKSNPFGVLIDLYIHMDLYALNARATTSFKLKFYPHTTSYFLDEAVDYYGSWYGHQENH